MENNQQQQHLERRLMHKDSGETLFTATFTEKITFKLVLGNDGKTHIVILEPARGTVSPSNLSNIKTKVTQKAVRVPNLIIAEQDQNNPNVFHSIEKPKETKTTTKKTKETKDKNKETPKETSTSTTTPPPKKEEKEVKETTTTTPKKKSSKKAMFDSYEDMKKEEQEYEERQVENNSKSVSKDTNSTTPPNTKPTKETAPKTQSSNVRSLFGDMNELNNNDLPF